MITRHNSDAWMLKELMTVPDVVNQLKLMRHVHVHCTYMMYEYIHDNIILLNLCMYTA